MRSKGSASFALWDQVLPLTRVQGPSSTPGIGRKGRPPSSEALPDWPFVRNRRFFEIFRPFFALFFCHFLLFFDKACSELITRVKITNENQAVSLACVQSCDIRLEEFQVIFFNLHYVRDRINTVLQEFGLDSISGFLQ